MEKVPRKGVACGSEVDEEKRDLKQMLGSAPSVCGMEGSTVVDVNKGPPFEE